MPFTPMTGKTKTLLRVLLAVLLLIAAVRLCLWTGSQFLIIDEQPQKSDVIIVLGYPAEDDGTPGAIMRTRVVKGVELFSRGYAPVLLLSGASVQNPFVEAEVMAELATDLGIPESAILMECQSTNTVENAHYSSQLMRDHGWHSAIVVTSPYHTRRASMLFSDSDIDSRIVAADLPEGFAWYERLGSIMHEYAAFLYYELTGPRE